MRTLYKVTGPNGESIHGGTFTYDLPTLNDDGTWAPGEWTPKIESVRVCHRGYHLTTDYVKWLKLGCLIWTAEGRGGEDTEDDKTAFGESRCLAGVDKPQWWSDVESFVDTIPDIPYFQPQGDPDPSWNVFDTWAAAWDAARAGDAARAWAAARDAAWDAARDAAGDAAGDAALLAAAGDAALLAQCLTVADLIDTAHLDHVTARLDVWKRGYGLLCDVDGVFYVYRKVV